MAEVSKHERVTPINVLAVQQHSITGLTAGEDLVDGDAVYIAAADAQVYKATGAAADEKARCVGFTARRASAGDPCTILVRGVHLSYGPEIAGDPVAPGSQLYLSATIPGCLSDVPTTGGTEPVAYVIDDSGRIMILAG
jgi:hypothetical protein